MPGHTGGASVPQCGNAIVASRDNYRGCLSLRVTTRLSLRATTIERLSFRATTRLLCRATMTRPPPHTRTYWLSHCQATLPLHPYPLWSSVCLSLRVTTLLSLCSTTIEHLSLRVTTRLSFRATTTRPTSPTHPDILAQPLPGHTTPTPLVKHLSLRVTRLVSLRATTRRLHSA